MEEFFKPDFGYKPMPVGVVRKDCWDAIRCINLKEAIARYEEAGIAANPEWIEELSQLIADGKDIWK